MAVAFRPCTVPGASSPSFELGDDEVELGVGIHGERGTARVATLTATEIAEALHLVMVGRFRALGLTTGRLGRLVVPERVIYGHRELQIATEGEPLFVAMLAFKDYPARTAPTMLAELRQETAKAETASRVAVRAAWTVGAIGAAAASLMVGYGIAGL